MAIRKILLQVKYGDIAPEKALEEILKLFGPEMKGVGQSARDALLTDIRALDREEMNIGETEREVTYVIRSIREDLLEKRRKKTPL